MTDRRDDWLRPCSKELGHAPGVFAASRLGRPLYRVVASNPPTAEDFRSYSMAGRTFPDELLFPAMGISMFTKEDVARKLAHAGALGTYVAEVHLDDPRILVAPENDETGHVTVWAFGGLEERVVRCFDPREGD
jgi:hypothetical protein